MKYPTEKYYDMTTMSVNRVKDSPFRETDWDRRLDDMLDDLGAGGGGGHGGALVARAGPGNMSQQSQQFSSSSMQQSYSYSSSSQQQQQVKSFICIMCIISTRYHHVFTYIN